MSIFEKQFGEDPLIAEASHISVSASREAFIDYFIRDETKLTGRNTNGAPH